MSVDYGQREVYERAAQIVAGGWCQGRFARGRTNRPCSLDSPRATKFCASAAIDKAARETGNFGAEWFVRKAAERLAADSLPAWNDASDRTQAQVTAFLRSLAVSTPTDERNP